MVTKHLTEGGIPSDWTVQNLDWLAQAHRRLGTGQSKTPYTLRPDWHRRWAALLTDILDTKNGENHRV